MVGHNYCWPIMQLPENQLDERPVAQMLGTYLPRHEAADVSARLMIAYGLVVRHGLTGQNHAGFGGSIEGVVGPQGCSEKSDVSNFGRRAMKDVDVGVVLGGDEAFGEDFMVDGVIELVVPGTKMTGLPAKTGASVRRRTDLAMPRSTSPATIATSNAGISSGKVRNSDTSKCQSEVMYSLIAATSRAGLRQTPGRCGFEASTSCAREPRIQNPASTAAADRTLAQGRWE